MSEPGLAVLSSFVSALGPEIATDPSVRGKLAPSIVSQAKSVSAATRASAVRLFTLLFSTGEESDLVGIADQVVTPLKTGKTTSPDHRTTLYMMLSVLPASSGKLSLEATTVALTALAKESNEHTVSAMSAALSRHVPAVLIANSAIPAALVAALVKGMADTKPNLRRIHNQTAGNIFWALPAAKTTDAIVSFAEGVLPGFENALKTITANTLNSPAGPLEGYVAVAVLKGRFPTYASSSKKINDAIQQNQTLQQLGTTAGAKPNFFLFDKLYRKIATREEGLWFVHALESFFEVLESRIAKDEAVR